MSKKVLFVATVVKTHINAFHIPCLKLLKEMGYETHVAAKNDYEIKEECIIPYCDVFYDLQFERSPIKKENLNAYKQLKKIIQEENYDIVHCHTPVGGVLARLACKHLGDSFKGTIMYTAHGFHFFKGAPIKNWLIFYPIEKWLSGYTDVLITINKEDYNRAKRKFKMKKLEYIPGVGVDIEKFQLKGFDRELYRNKLGLKKDDFAILSVGELNRNKNHEVIIRAIAQLNNNKIHYFIAGKGELYNYLIDLTKRNNIENQIHLLGFRTEIPQLLNSCDLYILPSKREGLNVSLIEAMAAGMPCIASCIRGNTDLLEEYSKFLVKPNDVNRISYLIEEILLNRDTTIYKNISKFSLEFVKKEMYEIYKFYIEDKR